jgi:hypothetical protein
MSIHAFILLVMLVVTWNILKHNSPAAGTFTVVSQRWAIIWGNLRFIWFCVFAFEAYKFVHWFLVAPDHQIVFVAGAFFIMRWVLKIFSKLLPSPEGIPRLELLRMPLEPVQQRRIFIYGLATIFWWGSLVFAAHRFIH